MRQLRRFRDVRGRSARAAFNSNFSDVIIGRDGLGQEPDSDFERWFLARLKAAGYEAHPQVGVAKYRIDIGIIHPDKPGNYIIGLECDGATYHSSKSARDRDRIRPHVLEELNWRIHRVWSTDWYRDPEREFSRLVQHIERARDTVPPQSASKTIS